MPDEATSDFLDRLAMVQSTQNDAFQAALMLAQTKSAFAARTAFIMLGRALDAQVQATLSMLEHFERRGLETVDESLLKTLRRTNGLADRVKASFKALADRKQPVRDFSGVGWAAVVRALEMRRRLVHPKCYADIAIDDDDLATLRLACDRFGPSVSGDRARLNQR